MSDTVSGLNDNLDRINNISDNITDLQTKIDTKSIYTEQQLKEIEHKKNLLVTRKRMLDVSKERNDYKRKIVYILLSVILALLLLLLSYYVYEVSNSNN
jgi:hypothetical protein